MTTNGSHAPLSISATWNRPLVAATGGEATLLVRISAPARSDDQSAHRAPIDVAFVLDRSGSMAGEKLSLVKEAVSVALGHLHDEDRAALVVYDHEVETLQTLASATPRVKTTMRLALQGVDRGGSTNLSGGWLTGCEELTRGMGDGDDRVRIRRALLLTDGLANVGITDTAELTRHAHELRRRGIATTTLGVGLDFDEDLLAGMAEAGGGNFQFIAHPGELRAFFTRELGELLTVIATDFTVSLTLPAGVRARLISAFPSEQRRNQIDVSLRDLSASETLCLVFSVTSEAGEPGTARLATLRASWADPSADTRRAQDLTLPPLVLADAESVAATPEDPEVAEEAAIQRAAAERRKAMRLDRQGRSREAKMYLQRSAAYLAAAPQSARVAEEFSMSAALADMDADEGYGEDVRKQVTFAAMRRLRGKDAGTR